MTVFLRRRSGMLLLYTTILSQIVVVRRIWLIHGFTSSAPTNSSINRRQQRKKKPSQLQHHQRISRTNEKQQQQQQPPSLEGLLQKCTTVTDILQNVGMEIPLHQQQHSSSTRISSLVLVRLMKIFISTSNNSMYDDDDDDGGENSAAELELSLNDQIALQHVVRCLVTANRETTLQSGSSSMESLIEGTKACSILFRLLMQQQHDVETIVEDSDGCHNVGFDLQAVLDFWHATFDAASDDTFLQPHQISGLYWSFDTIQFAEAASRNSSLNSIRMPVTLQRAYDALNLPFRIVPGAAAASRLTVANLSSEVNFRVDTIRTSGKNVPERRPTAWQGDDHVGPFLYSSKSMRRDPWSPTVRELRDTLADSKVLRQQYYDGCLLNLYPTGCSGMRYHMDPDQGRLWDCDTAVVSVGATRRFSFRQQQQQPHNFVVLHGDVTHMFADCQDRYQHCVKNADRKSETASRISLVFKRSLRDT